MPRQPPILLKYGARELVDDETNSRDVGEIRVMMSVEFPPFATKEEVARVITTVTLGMQSEINQRGNND